MAKTVTEAFYDTQLDVVDTEFVANIRDPVHCHINALPALAAERSAIAYSEGLLGEEYDREAVRRAFELNDSIGHESAFNIIAELTSVTATYTNIFTGSGNRRRITALDICVSTLSPRGVDPVRGEAFLTQIYQAAMPWRLDVHRGTVRECPNTQVIGSAYIGEVSRMNVDVEF